MTANTAVVLIDPYNDFLHPEGKVTPQLSESLQESGTINHLKELVTTARKHKIPIYYGLHQQVRPGYLCGWKHTTAGQESILAGSVFARGSWGAQIYAGLEPDLSNGDVIVSKHWNSRFAHLVASCSVWPNSSRLTLMRAAPSTILIWTISCGRETSRTWSSAVWLPTLA